MMKNHINTNNFFYFTMDTELKCAAATLIIGILLKRRKRKNRKQRSAWVKPWLKRRNERGVYNTLLQELRLEAKDEY